MSNLKTSLGRIVKLEQGEAPDRSAKGWKAEGEKRRVTKEKSAVGSGRNLKFGGFHRTQRVVEHRHEENVGRQGSNAQGGR